MIDFMATGKVVGDCIEYGPISLVSMKSSVFTMKSSVFTVKSSVFRLVLD